MKKRYMAFTIIIFLTGCGQSALDACTDSKSHLWNPKMKDNQYKGNERYWDAVSECEDKHG